MSDLLGKQYVGGCTLQRAQEAFRAHFCFCQFPSLPKYGDIELFLHFDELEYFKTLKYPKRQKSYLLGRYCAKSAVSSYTSEKNLARIVLKEGVFRQPLIYYAHEPNIQVSITHCEDFGAAVAFPELHPLSIDIEKVRPEKKGVIESQLTEDEKRIKNELSCSDATFLTIFWSAKEALSKILKCGLMTPFHVFELNRFEKRSDCVIGFYKNFAQYKSISFEVSPYICTLTCPKKTEIDLDLEAIRKLFSV